MDRKIKTIMIPKSHDDDSGSIYRVSPASAGTGNNRKGSVHLKTEINYITEFQMSDEGNISYKSGNYSNAYVPDWHMPDPPDK